MSSPDRVETISVHIDPSQVPDLTSCLNCGPNAPIVKVPGEYSFDVDGVKIVNTEPVPEFLCNRCGMDGVLDTIAVGLPLDRAILVKLETLGVDLPRQRALRESIARNEGYVPPHPMS